MNKPSKLIPILGSLFLLGLMLLGCGGRQEETSDRGALVEAIRLQLANPSRSDEDKARDAGGKPAQVIGFLGITDGMTVIDLVASSDYYTEVLSYAVGPTGTVYAQKPSTQFAIQRQREREGADGSASRQ